MSASQLSSQFFLQSAIIILTCSLVGKIARRLGQPKVVGEMLAGVCLGPSFLGTLAPNFERVIFPHDSLPLLYVGGQLGVGMYMFIVGSEFSESHFLSRIKSAVSVSLAGIVVPFALAFCLNAWIFGRAEIFGVHASFTEAALFLGASISITAFPMLARIIHERGLTHSHLGVLALSAGAIDDAAAWCILAFVIASFTSSWLHAIVAIGGAIAFFIVVAFIVRPALKRFERNILGSHSAEQVLPATIIVLFFLSTWSMDAAGIHAVFGGFILGACLPRGVLTEQVKSSLAPIVSVFLLPLFFTYSGLQTNLALALSSSLYPIALSVIAVSFLGKGGACWAAARLSGESKGDALGVAALMNSRGLMELIIINIGLQFGIITSNFFSIMVIMAVLTTVLATPIFNWSQKKYGSITVPVAFKASNIRESSISEHCPESHERHSPSESDRQQIGST